MPFVNTGTVEIPKVMCEGPLPECLHLCWLCHLWLATHYYSFTYQPRLKEDKHYFHKDTLHQWQAHYLDVYLSNMSFHRWCDCHVPFYPSIFLPTKAERSLALVMMIYMTFSTVTPKSSYSKTILFEIILVPDIRKVCYTLERQKKNLSLA